MVLLLITSVVSRISKNLISCTKAYMQFHNYNLCNIFILVSRMMCQQSVLNQIFPN
jgi:hypothetical protein